MTPRQRPAQKNESASRKLQVRRVTGDHFKSANDQVAVEEPLEIRLWYEQGGRPQELPLAITMRTPGHDGELALGFLFSEGIVHSPEDIVSLEPASSKSDCNTIRVRLRSSLQVSPEKLRRHFYATSSCGVCGKASLEALRLTGFHPLPLGEPVISSQLVAALPEKMAQAQALFTVTGGLHAAALFDICGKLLCIREDVGRHNALDKLIGVQLKEGAIPLHDQILMVSGRTSFEILQKALAAQIPVVAAVSAPSSLAVELARRFGITLLGFVRDGSFNLYADTGRLAAT